MYVYILTHLCERNKRGIELLVLSVTHFFFLKWILQQPKVTTYFGCISDDKNGAILKKHAEEEGVNVQFQFTHEQPTGTCAVLCVGNDR